MSVRDWTALGLLALTVAGVAINVAVSIALRARDREDFEDMRRELQQLSRDFHEHKNEFALLRGRLGDKS